MGLNQNFVKLLFFHDFSPPRGPMGHVGALGSPMAPLGPWGPVGPCVGALGTLFQESHYTVNSSSSDLARFDKSLAPFKKFDQDKVIACILPE